MRSWEVSGAERLNSLEEENPRVKKGLLADSTLDLSTLREMIGKTSEAPFEEICRERGHHREGLFPNARLCAHRH